MSLASPAPPLRLEGVDAGYGGRRAIAGVSLTVATGRRVGLVGPNGAGKSTLIRVALGLLSPWRGAVELFGVPPGRLDRRRWPVAYVPQARDLTRDFPASARDVVMMGRVGRLGPFHWPGSEDRAAVERALARVGLTDLAARPFGALSGGQQQRALLARALAGEACLLFLDEPVTGVDAATQSQIDELLGGLSAAGVAMVISTHDLSPGHLARFDWLVALNGQVVAQGPPAAVTTLDVWQRLVAGAPLDGEGG